MTVGRDTAYLSPRSFSRLDRLRVKAHSSLFPLNHHPHLPNALHKRLLPAQVCAAMARPSSSRVSSAGTLHKRKWRPTKMMNMRDLSKDDDFLSHLLVEKLGTGNVPLLVHKMDSSRRLPRTEAHALMGIVRRVRISTAVSLRLSLRDFAHARVFFCRW